MASLLPAGMSASTWMPEPPNLSDIDDTEDEVDAVLLSGYCIMATLHVSRMAETGQRKFNFR